jgi:hypothetical protein
VRLRGWRTGVVADGEATAARRVMTGCALAAAACNNRHRLSTLSVSALSTPESGVNDKNRTPRPERVVGLCPVAAPCSMPAARAEELANSFGARSCRVPGGSAAPDLAGPDPHRPLRPTGRGTRAGRPSTGVDLARVMIGRTKTGRPWVLRLLSRRILWRIGDVRVSGVDRVIWEIRERRGPESATLQDRALGHLRHGGPP